LIGNIKNGKNFTAGRALLEGNSSIQGITVMRILVVIAALSVTSGFSTQAFANPQTYCELLSRDYADGRTLDVDQWQINFRNAFSSCMSQYTAGAPDIPKRKSEEKVIKKAQTAPTVETPRRKRTPLLAPGSVAWNEYCAAKYVSYNKVTGTYKSYSGKPKPCLVPSG
jgi:hypothetical protein